MDAHDHASMPACRRLRTKMYYVAGRDHVNLRVSSPTAQYWCSHTTERSPRTDDYSAWTTLRTRVFWMEIWAATPLDRSRKALAAGASVSTATIG
jgi:hypothetical protein